MYQRLDALVRWVIILFIGLLPFFFIPVAWIDTTQAKVGLAATVAVVVGILWLLARVLEGNVRIPWTGVLAAAGLVPLAYAASVGVNGITPASWVGSGTDADTLAIVILEFVVLVLVACALAQHARAASAVVRSFMLGGFALAALKAAHFIFPQLVLGTIFSGETANAVGSWHAFGIVLGALVFLGSTLWNSAAGSGYWKYVFWITAALSAILLVIAGLFDVWLGLFGAFTLLLFVQGMRERSLRVSAYWKREWRVVALAAIALFFVVFGVLITNVLPERIRVVNVEVRPSFQGTLQVTEQALSRPAALLFGSGPNTFAYQWGLHKPIEVNQTPFWNADFTAGVASVPTSLVTVGIVGFLARTAFILALVWAAIRLWMAPRDDNEMPVVLSVAALYMTFFQLVSVPGPAVDIMTFAIIGLFIGSATPGTIHARMLPLRAGGAAALGHAIGVIVFALVAVFASLCLMRVLASEALVNRGIILYNATQDVARASAQINNALRIYPASDRAHRSAIELGLLELRALTAQGGDNDEARAKLAAALEDTIAHGLEAVAINETAYRNWLELASLYRELSGANVPEAYERARDAYERALAENPTSPLPHMDLAQLELLQKKPAEALQHLAAALQLKPDFAAAYYLASQIYAAQNDLQNAGTAASRAVQYAQDDPQAWYNLGVIAYTAKSYTDAAVALEQALARQAQFANAMYVLGLTYYELKRPDDAIKIFESLQQLEPEQEAVQGVLSNLRAGLPPVATTTPQGAAR